jgi:hypothetical protein
MSLLVWAIRVGGENHCVQGDTGELMPDIGGLSEQCENCGSSGDYTLVEDLRHYECVSCGYQYPILRKKEADTIF